MATLLAEVKNRWLYLNLATGLGKTTIMFELGHDIALDVLPENGRGTIAIHMVVVSAELVSIYRQRFAAKLAEAD